MSSTWIAAMGKGQNDELVRELCASARKDFGMKVRVGGGFGPFLVPKKLPDGVRGQVIVGSAAFRKGKVNSGFLRRLTKKVRRKQSSSLSTLPGKHHIHAGARA